MAEATIKVEDMSCGGCVRNVTTVLKGLPGVEDAQVSLEGAQAVVRYDPTQVSVDAMRTAVEDAGFTCPL
ncbi:heavy-metal-associated domain-containing protein [Aromatoleum diolicum]|uniref:Heavy metal transporter n=1 Tax=Aromatoleum diolicum TaxID=75796 RepID=A0ABX1QCM9_9RHOO|nr:heavy-metal-associated domain-containing protein [Aromatoleum diolicum]NMG74860.1 heavy metal transporter [Aromatoleum diolicum]